MSRVSGSPTASLGRGNRRAVVPPNFGLQRTWPFSSIMKQNRFPPGWDEDRVRRVISFYEQQDEDEAVAEDEAAFERSTQTFIEVPNELLPAVRELIAKHKN